MFDHRIRNDDIAFTETNLCANLGDQILLRDLRLVLLVVASRVDPVHSVQKDWIDLALIVVAEDEETLAQVKVDLGKVSVVELRILTRVGKMCEDTNDLFALRRLADLVKFVEVDDRVHGTALDDDLDDLAPSAAFVGIGVTFQEAAVGCSTQRDKGEVAAKDLADTFLHE